MNKCVLSLRIIYTLGFILVTVNAGATIAQAHVLHQTPPYVEAEKLVPFEFRLPGINSAGIQETYFYYRYRGENSYRQQRAYVKDNRIIANVTFTEYASTAVEYYLLIEYNDGNTFSWPDQNAEFQPASVEIISRGNQEQKFYDSISGEIAYTILSPDPDSRLRTDDFFMAITLFYEFEEAVPDSFLVQLNGVDISEDTELSPYLITYVPSEPLTPGLHKLELLYNSPEEMQIEVASWNFQIVTPAAMPIEETPVSAAPSGNLIASGQYQATARSQSYADQTTSLFRNNFRISGHYGNINYTVNAMLTTQEDPRLQPQNRFSAQIFSGNWLMLEAGHVYPVLNPYLIVGRRMYGVHSSFKLLSENLQFQFLYGELNRNISPLYRPVEREETIAGQNSRGEDILRSSYLIYSQPGGSGTYTREIMGARVGFGSGKPFGLSFSSIRVEDAMQSINVIRSYEDLSPELLLSMDPEHREELENNPNLLDIRSNDPAPQGNFAFATDMLVNLDDNRIQFRSDLAASLVNNDISYGVLDKDRADRLGFDLDDNIETLLDQLSWLIIINENLNALPLRIEDGNAEAFVPKGIFATQSRLNLNYFNHNASVQYQWVGPEFSSLANVGQRRDIAGYAISDRFRLLSNSLYLTLGHENLHDNVIGNRESTTKSVTNRVELGWYPSSVQLPGIRAGVRRRTRDNGVMRSNPFLPEHLVNASVRNVDQSEDEWIIYPNPRNNITMQYTTSVTQSFMLFDLNHDASFNYTHMTTVDRVYKYGDFTGNIFSVELVSSFPAMPVRTNLGLNMNKTKSSAGLNTLDIFGFNTGLSWYLLNNRFHFTTDLAMTFDRSETIPLVNRVYDGFNGSSSEEIFWLYYEPDENALEEASTVSYIIGSALRYKIHDQHSVDFRLNYTHLSDRYSALHIPNNHIVQLRYVYDL